MLYIIFVVNKINLLIHIKVTCENNLDIIRKLQHFPEYIIREPVTFFFKNRINTQG